MKALLKLSALLFVMMFNAQSANSAICTALGNGNWSNPANWSCGTVPSCGDLILIPSGITINVDIQVDLDENSSPACSTATYIVVFGTLQFVTGNKISLACGSGVDIMPGGSMLPGGGGGSSNWLKICNIVVWQTSHGPVIGFVHFGSPIPLPVEFLSFSVSESGNGVKLEWVVASERENKEFTIQSSIDGKAWDNVITVPSVGDHITEYTYEEIVNVNTAISSVMYFKLSQTNLNGEIVILDTKSISVTQNLSSLYPNPVKVGEQIHLIMNVEKGETSELHFFNALGEKVSSETVILIEGRNNIILETANMEKGIYFIKLSTSMNNEVNRVVVN